jgi:CDP-L-myo-inositol myo-inositolphosphotransferase
LSYKKQIRGKTTDGPVSRLINRRLSARLTRFIVEHKIPVTPNQLSGISFLVGVSSAPLYLYGSPAVAGLLVQISSILDGADGELARYLGVASRRGGFFDSMLDRICDVIVLVSASLYSYAYQGVNHALGLLVFMLAVTGSLLVSYLHYRAENDLGVHPALVGFMPSVASRDVRLFVVFVGSLVGAVWTSIVVVAILSYLYIVVKMIELWRI